MSQKYTKKYITTLLEEKAAQVNQPNFIEDDPISLPHSYSKKQDIEITGFWISMLAWGQRKTIINKGKELFELMDHAPYDFIVNHSEEERKAFLKFKHRTFNDVDTLYFLTFLQHHYQQNESLEQAFTKHMKVTDEDVQLGIEGFHEYFFSLPDFPPRTKKHVATPKRKSACKRINMFLRWMVRNDKSGVDFGIWNTIRPSQLICPLDVHVERVGKKLGLLQRKQSDWKAAKELTDNLKKFDRKDPVKYDFALFGLGLEKF